MPTYPQVSEHRTFFLFPFRLPEPASENPAEACGEVARTMVSELLRASFMPEALRTLSLEPDNDRSLWQASKARLSRDLHESVRKLLGEFADAAAAPEKGGTKPFTGYPANELTPDAVNALSGLWGRRGRGLELALNAKASARLGLDPEKRVQVRLFIKNGTVYFFASRIGVLALEVEYHWDGDPQRFAEVILEANHRLSHLHAGADEGIFWAGPGPAKTPGAAPAVPPDGRPAAKPQNAASLDTIARFLITGTSAPTAPGACELAGGYRWHTDPRIFLFSAVLFAAKFDDVELKRIYAYRLCKRYHAEYDGNEEQMRHALLPLFADVLHASSIEGGCVVVEVANKEFLDAYLSRVVRRVLVPLAVIALHEFRHLLGLAQESSIYVDADEPSEAQLRTLRSLVSRLINFRLYFRLSHASVIAHHNLVHIAWRRAFDLDRLLKDVTADVVEAEKVLSAKAQANKERRRLGITILGASAAAYITFLHVIEALFTKLHVEHKLESAMLKVFKDEMTISDFEALQHGLLEQAYNVHFGVILAAIGVGIIAARLGTKAHGGGHGH